jgi:hypothetical protein
MAAQDMNQNLSVSFKADVTKFTHHLVLSGESSNAFDDEAVACQRPSLVEAANLN